MQKARGQVRPSEETRNPPTACRHEVSGSVSPASRRAFHLSLTVLVHYRSQASYLALADGPASFNRDFPCPGLLRDAPQTDRQTSPTGLSPPVAALSNALRLPQQSPRRAGRPLRKRPPTPRGQRLPPVTPARFGLLPVRSPLLGESLACFLFLRVLRCFSSPGSPRMGYVFTHTMTGHHPGRVPPFGYPRINARLQLPVAFRSLPRPSSPSCAQASTPRPLRVIPSAFPH